MPTATKRTFYPEVSLPVDMQVSLKEHLVKRTIENGGYDMVEGQHGAPASDYEMSHLTTMCGCPPPPVVLISWGQIWKHHINWFISQLPPGISLAKTATAYRLNTVAYLPIPAGAFS